jgi:bifunctional oligoribonuclease and PAP phosphatase NrnA
MSQDIEKLHEQVARAQTIALFGHENIDCDAIGSILGLGTILESMGKECRYFTPTPLAQSMERIPGSEKIVTTFDYGTYDLHIFCDFTPYERIKSFTIDTPEHALYFDEATRIVIDHHIDDARANSWTLLTIKDTESTSNCGRLYEIAMRIRPEYITADVATYRYMGLLTDSGNFMYGKDANGERDFQIAGGLLAHGARKSWLIQKLFYNNSPALLSIGQKILEHATLDHHTLYTYYSHQDLLEYHLSDSDTEVVQIVLKSMTWYAVYLRLRHMGTYRSGSMRSGYLTDGQRVSVQEIARTFHGGGHMYAAGFTTPIDPWLSIPDDAQRIVSLINTQAHHQITSRIKST